MMLQQQSLKKVMFLLVLALLLGVGFSFLGASSNVHAATLDTRANVVAPQADQQCTPFNPTVPGGEAHWTKCINYSGLWTSVTVDGWVKDTRADGKCAQVKAIFNDGTDTDYSPKACPAGHKQSFSWNHVGASAASVYLFTS
jgi:hypothetical protein